MIFSWKVRDVYVDNGERIARENLQALNERIRLLDAQVAGWSDSNFTNRKIAAMQAIEGAREKQKQLDAQC